MSTVNSTARVPTISAATDVNTGMIVLTFSDGRTLAADVTMLTPDIQMEATLSGVKNKLIDAAAISRDTITGRSATLEDKYQAVREIFDRITSAAGTWNKIRSGEGSSGATGGLFVRALMAMGNKTREAVQAHLDTLTKEQISALKANRRVIDKMAELRPVSTDSDALLDSLMGNDGEGSDNE